MQSITFTAGIKTFSIKATDGLPSISILLEGITGVSKKTQDIVDQMNGAVIVTLTPAQSGLQFGKVPEGAKIEGPETKKEKSKKDKK